MDQNNSWHLDKDENEEAMGFTFSSKTVKKRCFFQELSTEACYGWSLHLTPAESMSLNYWCYKITAYHQPHGCCRQKNVKWNPVHTSQSLLNSPQLHCRSVRWELDVVQIRWRQKRQKIRGEWNSNLLWTDRGIKPFPFSCLSHQWKGH